MSKVVYDGVVCFFRTGKVAWIDGSIPVPPIHRKTNIKRRNCYLDFAKKKKYPIFATNYRQ